MPRRFLPTPRANEFLADKGRRPFDEVVKHLLRNPGVARGVLAQFPGLEAMPIEVEWLPGEYRPRQRTWETDLVGFIDPSTILHIEQQTDAYDDMNIRMMEYAALLATAHELRYKIYQIYLYTGDRPIPDRGAVELIKNGRGSIYNGYYFVDAGKCNAQSMIEHPLYEVAIFGLLAREIPDTVGLAERLVERAQTEFKGEHTVEALVACMCVAALRRRTGLIRKAMPMILRSEMERDPYFHGLFEEKWQDGWRGGRQDGRHEAFREACAAVLAGARFEVPSDFLGYVQQSIPEEQAHRLLAVVARASSLLEALEMAGIPWTGNNANLPVSGVTG